MKHTIEEIKEYVEEHKKEMKDSLKECKEAPDFLKNSEHFWHVWTSGCWLNNMLEKAGATKEQIHDIGFCHGQRSCFGNAYEWAIKYLEQFENNKFTDKPGLELADKINEQYLGV